jgi:hypothetical protein
MGIGGIILGAVIAVFAVVTQQYYLLFSAALMIAGGAYSMTFEPEGNSQDGARNAELKMATTSVGSPVPVVFGEVRLAPNYLHYDEDTYLIQEITEKPSGGKGGGGGGEDQVVGYKYLLKWEAGICMGPVDQIGMIYGMPGEIEMLPSDTWTTFSGDYVDINLSGTDDQEGAIRIYKGSSAQTRIASGDRYQALGMNYRNVCWALFGVGMPFTYGRSPSVPTYQFVVRRIPKCTRDDLSNVDEIQTRGSDTLLDAEYHQANPAAIIYEIITNKVWGRGLSSDIIDEDSFALCSEFFLLKKIGMSFTMDKVESISDVLEGIRRHLKTILTWDGEKYKLRCLMDVGQTHQYIQTLKQDEISSLNINRPMWENTINEVRAEFQSQTRAYRPDIVHIQDIANKEAVAGRVSPTRIQFSGFSLFNLTLQQAQRILSEMSYPYMTATWEMNRYKSQIEVGDIVRVIWNEFGTSITTTYWMVITIEDGASDDENIKITAVEDQLLSPVDGEELTISEVPGYYPWERWQEVDEGEVTLTEDPQPPTDPISPVHVFEMPAITTGMQNSRTLITGQRPSGSSISIEHVYSTDALNFNFIATFPGFSYTGTLVDAIPAGNWWDRSAAGFDIDLTSVDDLATFLAVNGVDTPEDDLETVSASISNFMLIQDEIIGVGIFEAVDSDTVKVRNIIRGMFGTPIRTHPIGENIFFFEDRRDGVVTSLLERENAYTWRGHPISRYGTYTGSPIDIQLKPDPVYKGLGQRPLAPEPVEIQDGSTMTIKVRPQYALAGAGVQRFFEAMPTPIDNMIQSFYVEQLDNTGTVVDPPSVYGHTWTPPDLDDVDKGLVTISAPKFSGAKTVRIYSAQGGLRSVRFAQFNVS